MYGLEYGSVLPNQQENPLQTFQQLRQYNDEKQLRKNQQDLAMAKYLADTLDFSNYATGTELDPVISTTLSNTLNDLTQRDLNGESQSNILMNALNTANHLKTYSQAAKTTEENARAFANSLKGNSSIDANQAYKLYKLEALHDFNANRPKDISQLDPNADYSNQVLQKYPQLLATNPGSIYDVIKGSEKRAITPKITVDQNGVKHVSGYQGEYFPGLNNLYDKNGKLVTTSDQIPVSIKLKGDTYTAPDGSTLTLADKNLYDAFNQNKGVRLYLNGALKTLYPNVDTDSPQAETIKRKLLQDELINYQNSKGLGYLNKMSDDVDASQKYHNDEMWAIKNATWNRQDENKNPQESLGAAIGKVLNGTYPGVASDKTYNGKPLLNVTGYLPNGQINSGKVVIHPNSGAKVDSYNGLYKDADGQLYTEDMYNTGELDDFGKPIYKTRITPIQNVEQWLSSISNANGKYSIDRNLQDFHKLYQPSQTKPSNETKPQVKNQNKWSQYKTN